MRNIRWTVMIASLLIISATEPQTEASVIQRSFGGSTTTAVTPTVSLSSITSVSLLLFLPIWAAAARRPARFRKNDELG